MRNRNWTGRPARPAINLGLGVWLGVVLGVALASTNPVGADEPAAPPVETSWEVAAVRNQDALAWSIYVERDPMPGRPAFRIETEFGVPPSVASETLMDSMAEGDAMATGERRRLLERTRDSALVHTYIDLPFMFSDRELAVRITVSRNENTGVHRIDWVDANDHLPPPDDGVLRLHASGYWEFRPMPSLGRTQATYVTRAEVGGALPAALRDRLMRGQAEDAVKRLARLIDERRTVQVAAPPPAELGEYRSRGAREVGTP